MTDYARLIQARFFVDWNFDDSYTDESANLISATGTMSLAPPEQSITASSGIISRMNVTLHNLAGRYSPLNTGSAITADIADGGGYHVPCYFEASIDGVPTYSRTFTGVMKIPQEIGLTSSVAPTVTFDCRSMEEAILQSRQSILSEYMYYYNRDGYNESQLIDVILTDAGLDSLATLDTGLFTIPFFWMDEDSPIEACWQLAAAAGGRFYANPDGGFVYENAMHWLKSPHNASAETLNKNDFVSISPRYNDAELYKTIDVEIRGKQPGQRETIWTSDTVYTIPPGSSSITVRCELNAPAYAIWPASYQAASSGGADLTSSVSVVQTGYTNTVKLVFTNAHATLAAQLRNLYIDGIVLETQPSIRKTAESADTFWNEDYRPGRTRNIRGNDWVQTEVQAEFIAEFLRDRQELPRLSFTLRGVPGDASRRLGDRITVDDDDVMSSSREAFITAINWRYGGGTFVQDIEAMDATTLYPNDGDYFIIGTDLLTAGTSEVVFY